MDTLSAQRTATVAGLVATSSEARAIDAHATSVIALEQAHGAPLRRVAVSTDPDRYSPAAAQVTVLESWIYATASQEALWAIERVSLIWRGGDWRVERDRRCGAVGQRVAGRSARRSSTFPGVGDASVR